MSRLYALLLASILLPACGQPALPTIRPTMPVATSAALELEGTSVRAEIRETVNRYLARKHPNAVIQKLYIAKSAINGKQPFIAECSSPRQLRRIEGHYDLIQRIAMVTTDTLKP